jgi:hypothetical protein
MIPYHCLSGFVELFNFPALFSACTYKRGKNQEFIMEGPLPENPFPIKEIRENGAQGKFYS